jgi:hypothetical protein
MVVKHPIEPLQLEDISTYSQPGRRVLFYAPVVAYVIPTACLVSIPIITDAVCSAAASRRPLSGGFACGQAGSNEFQR